MHRHLPQHRAVGAVVGVGRHRTDPEPREIPEKNGWGDLLGGWNPVKPKPGDVSNKYDGIMGYIWYGLMK